MPIIIELDRYPNRYLLFCKLVILFIPNILNQIVCFAKKYLCKSLVVREIFFYFCEA